MAYVLPLMLGGIVWVALFGMDSDGDGSVDLGPALRLIGIVGVLVAGTGLMQLWFGTAPSLPAESGGVLGGLVKSSATTVLGVLGGHLLLLTLILVSITLATGLSWFALMEWIGARVMGLFDRAKAGREQAAEWQRTRALRE